MDRIELADKYGKLAWKKNQNIARYNVYKKFASLLRSETSLEAIKNILKGELRGRLDMLKRDDIADSYRDYCTVASNSLKRVIKQLD